MGEEEEMHSVSQRGQRNWGHSKWKRGDQGDRLDSERKLKLGVEGSVAMDSASGDWTTEGKPHRQSAVAESGDT